MIRCFYLLLFFCALLLGCKDPNSSSSSLKIEREYETVHEEGLGTIRFFEPRQIRDDLWAKCFSVPPTFLSASASGDGAAAADPFADPAPAGGKRREPAASAQEILERAGITFGEGHYARYYPADSALVVVLPKDQMELVEAYTCSIGLGPSRPILIYTELYEIEEAFHRQLLDSFKGESDHTPERDALFASAKLGESSLEEACVLTCQSGMRATTEVEEKVSKVEVDPVLGADSRLVSLGYRYWHKEPEREGEPAAEFLIETQVTIEPGRYVSMGYWKVADSVSPRFRHLIVKVDVPNL